MRDSIEHIALHPTTTTFENKETNSQGYQTSGYQEPQKPQKPYAEL